MSSRVFSTDLNRVFVSPYIIILSLALLVVCVQIARLYMDRSAGSKASRIQCKISGFRAVWICTDGGWHHSRFRQIGHIHHAHVFKDRRPRLFFLVPLGLQPLDGMAHESRWRILRHLCCGHDPSHQRNRCCTCRIRSQLRPRIWLCSHLVCSFLY